MEITTNNWHTEAPLNTTASIIVPTLSTTVTFDDVSVTLSFINNTDNVISPEQILILQYIANSLWIYISPFIFALGMTGNCLNLLVLWRMNSWNRSTVLFLVSLSASDIMVLCSGLIRYWVRAVFDLDIRTLSNWGCKVNLFVLYTTMQFSSWIRVSVIFERFLMTHSPLTFNITLTRTKSAISLLIMLLILMGINGHFFWTNGLIKDKSGVTCGSLTPEYLYFDEFIFVYIDLTVMAALPFLVMLILSVSTIRLVKKSSKRRRSTLRSCRSRANDTPLTKMLLFSSFYFLLSTVPISIYFVVDSYVRPSADVATELKLDLAWSICYIFQYSVYAINFYVYISSNAHYRLKLKQICSFKNRYERRETVYRIQMALPILNLTRSQTTTSKFGSPNAGFSEEINENGYNRASRKQGSQTCTKM